jgi:hypothetical protein
VAFGLTLSACNQNKSGKALEEQFSYPKGDVPRVYIYQDSVNPIFETFDRIVHYTDGFGNHQLIERYNENFALVESIDILLDEESKIFKQVFNVGASQITAQIKDSVFMPWSGEPSKYWSTFPSTADSLSFILRSERSLNAGEGRFSYNDKTYKTISFTDSVFTTAIDLKNRRERQMNGVLIHEFAEGLGRVRIRATDGSTNLVLKRIITDDEWNKLRTK